MSTLISTVMMQAMQSEGRVAYQLPGSLGEDAQPATAVLDPESDADLVRFAQVSCH